MTITKLKPVDAIVVGTGVSGSIIAMEYRRLASTQSRTRPEAGRFF